MKLLCSSHMLRLIGHYVMMSCFDDWECWFWNPAAVCLWLIGATADYKSKIDTDPNKLSVWCSMKNTWTKNQSFFNVLRHSTQFTLKSPNECMKCCYDLKISYQGIKKSKGRKNGLSLAMMEKSRDDRWTTSTRPVMELGNLQSDGCQWGQHHLPQTTWILWSWSRTLALIFFIIRYSTCVSSKTCSFS